MKDTRDKNQEFLAIVGIFTGLPRRGRQDQRDGRQQRANDENGINKKILKFKLTQFCEQTQLLFKHRLNTREYQFNTDKYHFKTHEDSFNTHENYFNTNKYGFNSLKYHFNSCEYRLNALEYHFNTHKYPFNTQEHHLNIHQKKRSQLTKGYALLINAVRKAFICGSK